MIHELIDPKKKKNKTSVSGSTKTIQNSKNIFEYSNFESSLCENKNTEASSATFMPPWLRNSLRLNQRNVLSHATSNSDQKTTKVFQRNKAASQNEFVALKQNNEHNCWKEWRDQTDLDIKDNPQEIVQASDNAKTVIINSERIPASQNLKSKVFESKSSEARFLGKGDWVKADTNVLLLEKTEKFKNGDSKVAKLIRQKNSNKKRMSSDQEPYNLDKSEIDFLLQMKAREVVENLKKKELHSMSSETRNLETKLLLLGAKPHDSNSYKLKQQDVRWLQEMKNQMMSAEDFEGLVEHLKDMNLRDFIKKPELLSENVMERKREEKEDRKDKKSSREPLLKCEYEERFNEDEGLLLSSDDEDNIKRFSQFLSKNENLDEKKKCLEEVRNYFEKKRKSRLTKRRCLNEEKKKSSLKSERKEDSIKEKSRTKDSYKGMKSKFGICNEEIMEKAVEDTLQKFIESHHINASPITLETMKRSIFHCMSASNSKSSRSPPAIKKCNLDQLGLGEKDPEKFDFSSFLEGIEGSSKEPAPYKESKKKNFKTSVENSGVLKETNIAENEKFKRLRKEFDNFLHSVQFHVDFTNLKLQSVILEKEEQTSLSKNVQFVYNFTKKSLEQGKTGAPANKHCNDDGTQTAFENEVSKRNVKVQAFEYKTTCEQSLQTEIMSGVTEATQTNDDQVSVREIKELKSYDVNPGLYRMVKSKEPGKFYLYPEPDERKQSTNFSFVRNKKLHRKKDFLNVLSKSSSKDRRYFVKERERAKLRKIRKLGKALVRLEGVSSKQGKCTDAKTDSLSCLYFRNLDQSHSGLFTPNKEMTLTENTMIRTDDSEDLLLGDEEQIPSGDHLGCFWFWNGEKISPGCDLKTHVENLLKEKLKEMIDNESQNTALSLKSARLLKRNKKELKKVAKKNAVFNFNNRVHDLGKKDTLLSDEKPLDEESKIEEEKDQSEEIKEVSSLLSEEKPVRNVATQNSEQTCISTNPSKLKVQKSKIGFPIKKKTNKGNLVLKHRRGKPVNVRKAENIVEAIEELKRMKLEAENSKNGGSRDSDSYLNFSLSTKESKNEVDPLPIVFRRQESLEAVDSNFKNRLKKLVSLVNCENQRNDVFVTENVNSTQNSQAENHKHMALIETVLNKITHKDRESLWNDVRDFIKTRINRDRNDEDREVCIEIEQDLHKNDRGKLRDILAKGHYRRNEGDIEVEIDLTLDDLERILRQRQKNIRKQTLHRSNLSNKFLSTSSIQSEFTRDDFQRYEKYLESLTSGRGLIQEKEMKTFL